MRNNLENLLTVIKEWDITHLLCDRLNALIARRWFGPQTQWRPLRKAFTSGLGIDALSLAWPAVVQQVVSLTLARGGFRFSQEYLSLFHHSDQFFVWSLWCID